MKVGVDTMFVGRENELATLNSLYNQDSFQMVVIYGRRRIGKTTLISEFIHDKSAIFFTAQEVNDTLNLSLFSKKLYSFFNIPESTGPFTNWNNAFEFIAQKAREQRFILAFDEFPYAATANRSLKSLLQTAIDHQFKNTGLFLILCGSHMSFMENEVLGYKSPLFGRRTAQLKLDAFDYYDAAKMLSSFSNEDKLKFYACVGGTPHYLSQIRASESFKENILRLYFTNTGYLYNEPMMLLQQELREPAMYNSIIIEIAGGASKLNEIATGISEESPKVNKYLQTLVNLKIVNKIFPFGENPLNSRKGLYRITDNCYAFWYNFVFLNKAEIESGNGDIIVENFLFNGTLSTYVGRLFESICIQFLQRINRFGILPFNETSFGSWWGNDPIEKAQTDIDVIAANRNERKIIIGECKWKDNIKVMSEAEKLKNKASLIPEYEDKYYYLFVKTLKNEIENMTGVELVTVDKLFSGYI